MKKLYAIEHWSDTGGKGKNYYSSFSFLESSKFPHELIEHESEIQDECLYERGVKVYEVTKEFLENNFDYIDFCHSERHKRSNSFSYSNSWTMNDVANRVKCAVYWMKRTVEQCKILKRYPEFVVNGEELYCDTRQYKYNFGAMYPTIKYSEDIRVDLANELYKLGYISYIGEDKQVCIKQIPSPIN